MKSDATKFQITLNNGIIRHGYYERENKMWFLLDAKQFEPNRIESYQINNCIPINSEDYTK